jgi:hypothetical protein
VENKRRLVGSLCDEIGGIKVLQVLAREVGKTTFD